MSPSHPCIILHRCNRDLEVVPTYESLNLPGLCAINSVSSMRDSRSSEGLKLYSKLQQSWPDDVTANRLLQNDGDVIPEWAHGNSISTLSTFVTLMLVRMYEQ